VLFCCPSNHNGTMVVSDGEWESGISQRMCPKCGTMLYQSELHFEKLDDNLQAERVSICRRKGPLTRQERQRLRIIHAALGHKSPEQMTATQEGMVMDIASNVMRRYMNNGMD
jgi:hypothetical protein